MKYNIFGYLIGEGFGNILKKKKSATSSIMIMCATMFMFGIFLLITENVNHFVEKIESDQGMQVFVEFDLSESDIGNIKSELENMEDINTIERKTPEDALNIMKERYKENEEILKTYEGDANIFTDSFVITLTDLTKSEEVKTKIESLQNVRKVTSSDQTVEALINIANGIKIFTAVLLALLIMISMFIISNTIKLTVDARQKEISIMKYVGATNWFIRWPFMVEGIIIGFISSTISIGIIAGLYNALIQEVLNSDIMKDMGLQLISFNQMFNEIILVYMLLGIGLGAIGSALSMRKYLKV